MSAGYALKLKCQHCDLIPGPTAEMGFFQEHCAAEHADLCEITDDGFVKPAMEMVVVCERDDTVAPLNAKRALSHGRAEYHHRCPKCQRTYVVEANA